MYIETTPGTPEEKKSMQPLFIATSKTIVGRHWQLRGSALPDVFPLLHDIIRPFLNLR